jgi:hypothetical protein
LLQPVKHLGVDSAWHRRAALQGHVRAGSWC